MCVALGYAYIAGRTLKCQIGNDSTDVVAKLSVIF